MRYYIALVNAATTVPSAAAEVDSPAEPNHDGSSESDTKSRDFAYRPRRLWCSLPNIGIYYTDNTFDDTEVEYIAPMPVLSDPLTYSSTTVTEPGVTQIKLKPCSL